MSITDELRDWAHGFTEPYKRNEQQLLAIADRIDAALAERYVELPKDADGVPIRVGDVMRDGTVTCIRDAGKGWEIVLDYWGSHQPCDVTHHHEPTVEDVLQKLLEQAVGYSDAHTTVALYAIAEYAAKLRLAGDAE